jgi:2-polyprenyl-3-methyl-5-hydroxy-6-metoxy-1,4-benzoquinol methylase
MKITRPTSTTAITTPDYWEGAWKYKNVPDVIDPHNDAPENHYYQVMHAIFVRALGARCSPGARLIEIGCGGSRWLPYFHRTFGYAVSGIDYTVEGTRLSQLILDKVGINGRIVQSDLFEPPLDLVEQFEVVVSFGLVEHFKNTSQVVSACARYLRPGGQMITLVPTMRGLYGTAYRILRPDVYRKHIPQSQTMLAKAHSDAGLSITHSCYVLGLPGVVDAASMSGVPGRMALAVSRLYWRLERSGFGVPPNRFTSPYALCIATKPLRPASTNEHVVNIS